MTLPGKSNAQADEACDVLRAHSYGTNEICIHAIQVVAITLLGIWQINGLCRRQAYIKQLSLASRDQLHRREPFRDD